MAVERRHRSGIQFEDTLVGQASHPDWRSSEPWDTNVSSYAIDDNGRLVLFDPLGVPSKIEALAAERESSRAALEGAFTGA